MSTDIRNEQLKIISKTIIKLSTTVIPVPKFWIIELI